MDYDAAALALCAAGKFLYKQGWSPATSSNYSVRLKDQQAAITVSGKHKGQLKPDDIMRIDLDGHSLSGDLKPSAETLLHTYIYKRFGHVSAVLHTHSANAVVLSRQIKTNEWHCADFEIQKAFEGVSTHESRLVFPIFENTQDINALAMKVDAHLLGYPETYGYLIRGHGLYTWGSTLSDALRHVEAMEYLAECTLLEMRLHT